MDCIGFAHSCAIVDIDIDIELDLSIRLLYQ